MQQFKQNETTATYRRIYMFLANPADGYTPVTTLVGATVNLFKNGVAFGSQPTTPATLVHIQSGHWYYEMASSFLSDLGILTVTVQDTNIRPVVLMAQVVAYDPTASTGISAADVWTYGTRDLTGSVAVASIANNAITAASITDGVIASEVWNASLASYNAGSSFGQRILRSSNAQSECDVSASRHIAADVHALQNAVITAASIATGAIDADAIASDAITAAKIATGAIDADAIAADAITAAKIADSAITIRLSSDATASEARLIAGTTASDVWGALLASYTTNNTFGQRVLRSTTSQSECAVTGSHHIAADIHELQAGVITASGFSANAIDATVLSTDASNEIADALLNRNIGGGSSAGRLVKEALYALRNKSEIVGTTLSVYDAVDALSWTAAVASSASADPVTGIDP
jgi:hypothetical protein